MTADNTPPTPSPPPRKRKHKRWRTCCLGSGIIIGTILGMVVWVGFGARRLVASHMAPEDYATLAKAKSQIVTLPDPWHSPAAPISPEADDFARKFVCRMVEIDSKYENLMRQIPHISRVDTYDVTYNPHDKLSPEGATSWTLLLQDMQPVIDMTSAAVSLSTYTMEADFSTTAKRYSSDPRSDFAELISLAAQQKVRDGNCTAAVELALLPLRMLKRTEQARGNAHETSLAITNIVLVRIQALARTCPDPSTLELADHQLDELYTVAFPGNTDNWKYYKTLGRLRLAAAEGYPVDLSPQPAINWYRKAERLVPEFYEWQLATFPPRSLRVEKAKRMLAAYSKDMNRTFVGMKRISIETPGTWQNQLLTLTFGRNPETISFLYSMVGDRSFLQRIETAHGKYSWTQAIIRSSLTSAGGIKYGSPGSGAQRRQPGLVKKEYEPGRGSISPRARTFSYITLQIAKLREVGYRNYSTLVTP